MDQLNAFEILSLESSMFTLGRKCFKICSKDPTVFQQNNSEQRKFHQECMRQCSQALIQTREYYRMKLFTEIKEVKEKNQQIFDNYP